MVKRQINDSQPNITPLSDGVNLTCEQEKTLEVLHILLSSNNQEETIDNFMDYVYQRFPGTEISLFTFHDKDQLYFSRSRPVFTGKMSTGKMGDKVFPALSSQSLIELTDLDNNDVWCQCYQPYFPYVEHCLQAKVTLGTHHYILLMWNDSGRQFTQDERNQLLFAMELTKFVLSYLVSVEDFYVAEDHLSQQQKEKLTSLGKLAAGVAHEINNPLGFVMSNFSTLTSYLGELKMSMAGDETAHDVVSTQSLMEETNEILSETMEGLTRIQNIVSSLNVYSHSDLMNYSLVDMRDVVTSALSMTFGEPKFRADIDYVSPEIPYYVLGQISKLRQVLIDVVMNALQSIHKQPGIVSIRLEFEENGLLPSKRNILLIIQDNGKGIEAHNLGLVFDPFFTTKQVGSGAGLGLSVAREILDDHRGKIVLSSQPDKGTKVEIRLPCVTP